MTANDLTDALLEAAWAQHPVMQFNTAPSRPAVEAPPIASPVSPAASEAIERARNALMEGMER